MGPQFTDEQRKELLSLELYPEQIHRLETHALGSISWRVSARRPAMADVREKLSDLAKALKRAQLLYARIRGSKGGAASEAFVRLYSAEVALGFESVEDLDKLYHSLETASSITLRALEDLPQSQRTRVQGSAQYVGLIRHALELGHVEHHAACGRAAPRYAIEVARKASPFAQVVLLVGKASGWIADDATEGGEWIVDEAIRSYSGEAPAPLRAEGGG